MGLFGEDEFELYGLIAPTSAIVKLAGATAESVKPHVKVPTMLATCVVVFSQTKANSRESVTTDAALAYWNGRS
jgi:hypothetical protein